MTCIICCQSCRFHIIAGATIRSNCLQFSLGTDGAPAVAGDDKGASGRLKRALPHLISIHCVAHRLALGSAPLSNSYVYPIIGQAQKLLSQAYQHFDKSPKRQGFLKLLDSNSKDAKLKVLQPHQVRWLSVSGVCGTAIGIANGH